MLGQVNPQGLQAGQGDGFLLVGGEPGFKRLLIDMHLAPRKDEPFQGLDIRMVKGESRRIQGVGLMIISGFIEGLSHIAIKIFNALHFIFLSFIEVSCLIILVKPDQDPQIISQ